VATVTAVVVLHPGEEVGEVELIAHVASRIASHKKPQRNIFAAEIPKTAAVKLIRKQLRYECRQ